MKQVYIIITDNCNLSCKHCIRDKLNNKGNMTFDDFCYSVDAVSKVWDNVIFVISGGEPTMNNDFDKMLSYCENKYKNISINTNGATSYWESSLCLLHAPTVNYQISIDGISKVHDSIRGLGAFDKAIRTINRLLNNDKKVVVSTTVSQRNKQSICDLAEYLIKIGVKDWSIQKEMPFGEARYSSEKDFSISEWNELCDTIIKYVNDRITIHTRKLFDFSLLSKLSDNDIKTYSKKAIFNCGTAKRKLYIHPDLSVYGCTCLESMPLGNLHDNSIIDIFQTEKYQYLSDCKLKKQSPCNSCRYVKLCNGGCPGMSKKYFGDIGIGDIRCPIIKEYYKKPH